jgi:hypothetical protein
MLWGGKPPQTDPLNIFWGLFNLNNALFK